VDNCLLTSFSSLVPDRYLQQLMPNKLILAYPNLYTYLPNSQSSWSTVYQPNVLILKLVTLLISIGYNPLPPDLLQGPCFAFHRMCFANRLHSLYDAKYYNIAIYCNILKSSMQCGFRLYCCSPRRATEAALCEFQFQKSVNLASVQRVLFLLTPFSKHTIELL